MIPEGFNLNSDIFKNIFKQITDQLDINPKDINTMSPQDIMKKMKDKKFNLKGPFMFGFNMRMGPNGTPQWDHFGNIKSKPTGESEIQHERDPLVDIYHENEYLVVVVEVPDVKKENIELKTSTTELEITTKNTGNEPYSRNYHKNISLPIEIDPDIAKARYKNGILEVKLKKVGESVLAEKK